MKKNEFENTIKEYTEYVKAVNPYVKPTKGVNSGATGRLIEMVYKYATGRLPKRYLVSPAGRTDSTITIDGVTYPLEVKNSSSTLGSIAYNGIVSGHVRGYYDGVDVHIESVKNEMLFYVPFPKQYYEKLQQGMDPVEALENEVYLLPMETFIQILEELRLIKAQRSNAQIKANRAEKDEVHMQTFSTSKKKSRQLAEALEPYKVQ